MSNEPKEPNIEGGDALSEALRVYLEHRSAGFGESDTELLRRHPDLRELLEPLLEQDDSPARAIRPGAVIGDYRLIEAIGRGGMGAVWEAEQISLKRRVALKLLRDQVFASAHSTARFRREALAGARLTHPCIAAVHAVGEAHGIHFIAQELIESRRTLSTLVREARESTAIPPNWWRDIAQLFAQLADALQVAHENGIIHRDIKPSNILITKEGTPKLVDFGLAMVAGEMELSRTGDLSGSPFYMSPEQAAAKRVEIDERSDVFSLGASLFEALTLQRPFEGDTVAQVLTKILFQDARDPREIRSLCPRDLAVICLKMLEKSPAQRYPSMRVVADELERSLRNEPIRARAPGVVGRSVKWSRRHPVLAASSAIVCVSLCVVTGLLFETFRARKAAEASASAALAAAEEAGIESRTSSRITDFLVGAFVEASPTHALGREVTAREVLDRGVKNIRAGLTEPTEAGTRARLLDTFGMVYSRLGLRKQAEDLLLEAMSLGEATFGPSDDRTLGTAKEIARLYVETARIQPGLEMFAAVHRARVARDGAEALETLRVESNLGSVFMLANDLESAELHLKHSLAGLERAGEFPAPALYGLSEVQRLLGRKEESLATLQRCLRLSEAQRGPDSPDTLTVREALARHLHISGDAEGAARLYRQAAASRACVQGEMHPETISTLAIAVLAGFASDPESALSEMRRLHAECAYQLGVEDPTTVQVAKDLAALLHSLCRNREAEEMYAVVIASMTRHSIGSPLDYWAQIAGLGEIERRLGRPELALSLLEELIDHEDAQGASDPTSLRSALFQVIALYDQCGRVDDALAAARRWLELVPEVHPQRANVELLVRDFGEELANR